MKMKNTFNNKPIYLFNLELDEIKHILKKKHKKVELTYLVLNKFFILECDGVTYRYNNDNIFNVVPNSIFIAGGFTIKLSFLKDLDKIPKQLNITLFDKNYIEYRFNQNMFFGSYELLDTDKLEIYESKFRIRPVLYDYTVKYYYVDSIIKYFNSVKKKSKNNKDLFDFNGKSVNFVSRGIELFDSSNKEPKHIIHYVFNNEYFNTEPDSRILSINDLYNFRGKRYIIRYSTPNNIFIVYRTERTVSGIKKIVVGNIKPVI
jgi:hypothetical protein